MKALYFVPLITFGLLSPVAFGQGALLDKTTLGKSQNSGEDLANSLRPGPQKFGKGEKKSEVDPKTLQSKTIKDPTFQGGLNDLGLDWNGNGVGKPHGDGDVKSTKKSDINETKNSKTTDTTGESKKSTEASAQSQGGEQKVAVSKSDDKSAEKRPDKQKSSESGGDH